MRTHCSWTAAFCQGSGESWVESQHSWFHATRCRDDYLSEGTLVLVFFFHHRLSIFPIPSFSRLRQGTFLYDSGSSNKNLYVKISPLVQKPLAITSNLASLIRTGGTAPGEFFALERETHELFSLAWHISFRMWSIRSFTSLCLLQTKPLFCMSWLHLSWTVPHKFTCLGGHPLASHATGQWHLWLIIFRP